METREWRLGRFDLIHVSQILLSNHPPHHHFAERCLCYLCFLLLQFFMIFIQIFLPTIFLPQSKISSFQWLHFSAPPPIHRVLTNAPTKTAIQNPSAIRG